MPYEGEFASYGPLRRLVQSSKVQELLRRYRIVNRAAGTRTAQAFPQFDEAQHEGPLPAWVLAIDGSHAEVALQNGFPGAEASYVTVASVLIDMAKMAQLDRARPMNPVEFRKVERSETIDAALPGANVVFEGDESAQQSLRRALLDVMQGVRMSEDGESLLDTYEALLAYKPTAGHEQQCPYPDCEALDGLYVRGSGSYECRCRLAKPLFSTDALRIHEGLNEAGTNGAAFAEVMQVWERIWVIHILRTLEIKGWLSLLSKVAIVLDGPLAVFGHPAWLSQAISDELIRLNELVKQEAEGQDMLMLGIEKTGSFVDHFEQLDSGPSGELEWFPQRGYLLFDDDYIKKNIIFSSSAKPYGIDTYYGRKFLYKTTSGARIVGSVPFLSADDKDLTRADADQYPRLFDALSLLNHVASSRFENAVSPLISAHAEAAIPLSLGSKVLEKLARELIGQM